MRILVLNGGSSSFKCALYELSAEGSHDSTVPTLLWKGRADWPGAGDLATALDPLMKRAGNVDIVGHRIVHGGQAHRATQWITDEVRAAVARNAEMAPAHARLTLEAMDAVSHELGPQVRQAAVFDTAFHAGLEPAAYVYPGPYEWLEKEGIRRFGFHGISYQYSGRRAADVLGAMPHRMLICHLGSGASLCAVRDGKSIDTTMGFTPLDGLMMSSRSGAVDPAILIYLLRHRGYSAEDLDRILNKESGLLGVSGFSGDMRAVLRRRAEGDPRAILAFDVYIHRLTREAGGMLAVLGGLDALVFTGGVGENSPEVRNALCAQLGFLGVRLDGSNDGSNDASQNASRNARATEIVSAADSAVPVLVIPADEESEIARECARLYAARS